MVRTTIRTIAAAALLLLIGISAHAADLAVGDYTISDQDGALSIRRGDAELFRWLGVNAQTFEPGVNMSFGFFKFKKNNPTQKDLAFAVEGNTVKLTADGADAGAVTFEQTDAGSLRARVSVNPDLAKNAVGMSFACAADDRFWGFGEQYNYVDLHGRALKIWVQEQGVGRDEEPPTFPPGRGSFTDTYFPMPYFMDPAKRRAFLIENSQYSYFDLCKTDAATWQTEVWDTAEVSFLVWDGATPEDLVAHLTAEVGRPDKTPPDWAFSGVWLAAQGGTKAVYKRFQEAMDADVPVTAMWVQDWLGKRQFVPGMFGVKHRWVHDEEFYPELDKLIQKMADKGVRFLGYFNPFVLPDYEHFEPAVEKGYLPLTPDGKPYTFQIITFPGSVVDVTNPEAVEWFKGYARKAIAMGQKGWMCDYGESMPYDGTLHVGDGRSFHNLYPTAWHRINREVLEEAFPDGDYILLTRSGYTYEHSVAQVVWAADQEQEWADKDGIPTVVRAALTIGLSGIPFYSHDVAGFSGGPSTKELFMRWTELGAFTPFMRTHDGLRKKENHRFNSDAETLAHFKKMADIHAALFPYFKKVADQAVTHGLPMIRHTVLVDPDWPAALDAHKQWMIGRDLLFAPVTEQGASEITVHFPEGEWEHLLTGEVHAGRTTADVSAPIGTPAVFVRRGAMDDVVAAVRAAAGIK